MIGCVMALSSYNFNFKLGYETVYVQMSILAAH